MADDSHVTKVNHFYNGESDGGLGLAVCRGIVEAHGGRLRVENDRQDVGTVFTVAIPAAEWETGVAAPTVVASETVRSLDAVVKMVDYSYTTIASHP